MATDAQFSVVEKNILNCTGNELFDLLELKMNTTIPVVIRNILIMNDIDSALVLSRVNESCYETIQNFMRLDFSKDIIPDEADLKNYLGIYATCQQKFTFSVGQKILLEAIVEHCKQFFTPLPSTTDKDADPNSDHDDNEDTSEDAPITRQSKKEHLDTLYRTIYKWMKTQNSLNHVSISPICNRKRKIYFYVPVAYRTLRV